MRLPEEDIDLFCCDEGELEYLQEEVEWLAEDVMNIDEHQTAMLNLMRQMCEASMSMLDVIQAQEDEIIELRWAHKILDEAWFRRLTVMLIWLVVLSWVVIYNVLV